MRTILRIMVSSSGQPSPSSDGVQVVRRVAAVLAAVGDGNGRLRLADLDDVVGLAKTTTHRLVSALAAERYLRIDDDGRIWLGGAIAELAARSTALSIAEQLRPTIEAVAQRLDETVDLSVLEGDRVRFVDQIQSTQALRAVSEVGASFPLDTTANGKAFLGALDDAAAARLVGYDRALELATELESVRRDGVAFDLEEHTRGISAAGVVVRRSGVPVAAISVPVPADRFVRFRDEIVDALIDAATSAST